MTQPLRPDLFFSLSLLCEPIGLGKFALAAALLGTSIASHALPRCEGKLPMSQIGERQEATLVLLREKKYDALQARMDGFLKAYEGGAISDEELFYEFGAFDRWGPFLTPLVAEWLERHPKSFAAHQAMALHLAAVAWQVRGGALAKETSSAQMQEFVYTLRRARGWAQRAIPLHAKPILAYQQIMVNARALHYETDTPSVVKIAFKPVAAPSSRNPRPDVLPLLAEAARIQPDNVIVRNAYVSVLAPKWGGSMEALLEYARPETHTGLSPDRLASVRFAAINEIAGDHYFNKRWDQAVEAYKQAANVCHLNGPWIDIGNIRLNQQRYADALAAGDAALAIVPGSSPGRRLRAIALNGLGRHAEAFELFQKLAPEGWPEITYFLGTYYASGQGDVKRDLDEACRLLGIAARGGEERAAKLLATLPATN